MDNSQPDAALNALHGYVYEGVWEKYSEPAFRRWVWTLKDSNALLVLGCIAMLLAFTQTRAWVLTRYAILQRKQPIRFPEDAGSEPLRHLSQGKAVVHALPSITNALSTLRALMRTGFRTRTNHEDAPTDSDSPVVSPWFGIFALFNIALFVIIGVAIPWFLTEGALEDPIVKSKVTDKCLTSTKYENVLGIIAQLPKSDAILQQCLDQLNEGCENQYYLKQPQINRTRAEACPFPRDICHNGTKPFEITHSNIWPYEVGVNSKARLTMNHRLTCAPVYLESFLLFTPRPPHHTFISVRNFELDGEDKKLWANFSMPLNTMNGPNIVSNESSGLRMARENGPYDLNTLPRYWAGSEEAYDDRPLIHPDLQRHDGESFLIIHRAGATKYVEKISDPFFAAQNEANSTSGNVFYPDYEATALGCLEQFQYCLPNARNCTPWGPRSRYARTLTRHPAMAQDTASLAEVYVLFRVMPSMFAVYDYLSPRVEWHGMTPLTHSYRLVDGLTMMASAEEQWVTEVETWFMKGILDTILVVQNGARFPLKDMDATISMGFKRQYSLCGRILFRDRNYTNVNWLGFWATTASLIFICLMSCIVERIHKSGVKCYTFLGRLFGDLVKLLIVARTWTALGELRRTASWGAWITRFWRASSFFNSQSFPARNARRGSRRPPTQTSELDDIEPAHASHNNQSRDGQ